MNNQNKVTTAYKSGGSMSIGGKALLALFGVLCLLTLTDMFFDRYSLQSPVVLRSPIIRRTQPKKNKENTRPNLRQDLSKPTPTSNPTSKKENSPSLVKQAIASEATDEQLIKSYKHGELMWKVYGLESTWGKNDGCREKGQYNGWGYGQSTFTWNCFDSLQIVAGKVNAWFNKYIIEEGYSVPEALCYYNTGTRQPNCMYYQNYLSL